MLKTPAFALLVFLLAAMGAQAQTATGTMQGTVEDDTGAVIVAAKVKLTDLAANQAREQDINEQGDFEFR